MKQYTITKTVEAESINEAIKKENTAVIESIIKKPDPIPPKKQIGY